MDILISLGNSAADAFPTRTATTWQQFVQWLAAHPRSPAGLSPAEYVTLSGFPTKSPEGQRIHADKSGPYVVLADFGGGRRALDSVLGSYGVPLDFDTGSVTEAVIRATLNGYAWAGYSTYSHFADNVERWRVFVPVSRAMSAAEHYATWKQLSEAFPGGADPAAKDPSRLSYLPGKCLFPDAARFISADGVPFPPAQVLRDTAVGLQAPQSDGPVPGWAGPADDDTLVTIACNTRTRPDERFGGPIHFAQLWTANVSWLEEKFPPTANEQGQSFSRTQADMALAGELAYWTGSDRERMHRLMLRSGLARDDSDWQERKVLRAIERAIENATQWHFMTKVTELAVTVNVPAGTDVPAPPVAEGATPPPPVPSQVPSAMEATLLNAGGSINDYWAYLPDHTYIHRPTGTHHIASTVDELIGKDVRAVLVPSRPVHALTWAPGFPERFQLREMDKTNERAADAWLYNTYQPPRIHKTPGEVGLWLALIERLFPEDVGHLLDYFADAAQNPDRKCNHAIVLGSGVHGVGKDTLLAPIRYAVGERNFRVIKPSDLVASFNPWVATRVLQVSESRDLGDGIASVSRYEMYERCKDLCAAPPATIECNAKYKPQTQVLNVLRLILTTNHRVDGIYIPPEDRRHFCAWSDAEKMEEEQALTMHHWYASGGLDFVAHWLMTRDLTHFNRTAPPPQTPWWFELTEAGRPVEDDRFRDAFEKLGKPEWVTLAMVAGAGSLELAGWIAHPGNRKKVEREMERAGYRRLPNPTDERGRWYVEGQRVPIYRRKDTRAADLIAKFSGRKV